MLKNNKPQLYESWGRGHWYKSKSVVREMGSQRSDVLIEEGDNSLAQYEYLGYLKIPRKTQIGKAQVSDFQVFHCAL